MLKQWSEEIATQKERLFAWAAVAFGLGIALYFSLPVEPRAAAGPVAVVLALPLAVAAYRRQHDGPGWFAGHVALAACVLAALGFTAAQLGTYRHGTPILAKPMKFAQVTGTVESVEKLAGTRGSRAVLSQVTIEDRPPADTPRKVRLSFRKDDGLAPGRRITTLARLDAPSGPVAPGGYDFRRHLFFDGIGAVGFAYRAPEIIATAEGEDGASSALERLRGTIDARIHARSGEVAGGIMSALITGFRGAIDARDDDAMRDSGLYHLLSISGAHVAMVAGALFFSTRLLMACWPWLALHWPIKKIAAAIALAGAAFYVALAGAEVPAVRALLMTGLVMIAIMLDRSPLSLRLIAFSALAVLCAKPSALTGVSFQMSFAAVTALICFFDHIRSPWITWYASAGWFRRAFMYLVAVLLTSLIAGTVTGVFSLYHFQSFALYGVLSNMIAVPLTGAIIMPAAVAAMLLMPFGWEAPALWVMERGCLWILAVAHWAGGLDGATIHVRQWSQASFTAMAAGLILFMMWKGWRGKAIAALIMAGGVAAAVASPVPDLFVSATGKLIGIRTEQGLYVSSGRREKFAGRNWQRLAGFDDDKRLRSFGHETSPVACDDGGCRWQKGPTRVSIIYSEAAAREDCGWADLMIATVPVGPRLCRTARVHDLYDARVGGAATFMLGASGIEMRSVGAETGQRPWRGGPGDGDADIGGNKRRYERERGGTR